jgi:hypothetical protein
LIVVGDAGSIDRSLLTELGAGSTENVEEPKKSSMIRPVMFGTRAGSGNTWSV